MGSCGWTIRLYKADDFWDDLDIIGNFKNEHNRQKDEVIVFSGMYGIDDYFIWLIHKSIGTFDFSTVNIDLSLYADGSKSKTFWRRQYKILDIKYDARESRYVLFGMSLDSVKLQTKLVDYQVKSLSWEEDRPIYRQEPTKKQMQVKKSLLDNKLKSFIITRAQHKRQWEAELKKVEKFGVLVDVLEKNEIFNVEYIESPYEADLRNFEYRIMTFNENWSVYDFIHYIASQNHFEWFVRNGVLYIGNECKAIKGMDSTRKFDLNTDNISSTAWFKKYSGETRPMDVMSHIGSVWRCVWVKHSAGKSGGVSKGCFTRIGIGALEKENYLKTLEGEPEKTIAAKLFAQNAPSNYVILGNIIKDLGDPVYVDEVSIQRNKELYKINEPSEVSFDRQDYEVAPLKQIKEKVVRSTPFLDHKAGILFPSPIVESVEDDITTFITPPNSVLFQVEGKEESTIVGPYVMGNGEDDFIIPAKEKEDFRLSFRNGWTMYVDKDGRTMIQASARDPNHSGPFPKFDESDPNNVIADKATTYMYMTPPAPIGGRTRGAAFSFNCVDGENADENKPHGGTSVRFSENLGVSISTKHKSNKKGIEALFEKTKYRHTAREDVTDLDDPPSTNKTTYEQENAKILLKFEKDSDLVQLQILPAEIDISLNSDNYINIIDGVIDISTVKGRVRIDASGNIDIESDGNTTINSTGDIKLDAGGKVDINGSGEVTIDGTMTKIQGGGNKLSYANHQHLTGNMGAPIPSHIPLEGTTKTEAS